MKFPYIKLPSKPTPAFPEQRFQLLPLIPVTVYNSDKSIYISMLIDSGASKSLFPSILGEEIGFSVKNQHTHELRGIGSGIITAYFHHIEIEIGGHKTPFYAGFTHISLPFPILGQDFFELYKIKFHMAKETIEVW